MKLLQRFSKRISSVTPSVCFLAFRGLLHILFREFLQKFSQKFLQELKEFCNSSSWNSRWSFCKKFYLSSKKIFQKSLEEYFLELFRVPEGISGVINAGIPGEILEWIPGSSFEWTGEIIETNGEISERTPTNSRRNE